MRVLDSNKTIYKPIPKFEHLVISDSGVLFNLELNREISSSIDKNGYSLLSHGESELTKFRHRLVAMAWLELPENYLDLMVNHLNGIPGSDHYSNLEWATRSTNVNHAIDVGLIPTTPVFIAYGKGVSCVNGYTRAGELSGINRAVIADGLTRNIVYVRGEWRFSLSEEALGSWLPTNVELIKFGEIRVYKDDVLVLRARGSKDIGLINHFKLRRYEFAKLIELHGSDCLEGHRTVVHYAGKEHALTKSSILPKPVIFKYWAQDINTGEVIECSNHRVARKTLGITIGAAKKALSNGTQGLVRPGYRVSSDPGVEWGTTLTYKELRGICSKVILILNTGNTIEASSFKKLAKLISNVGLGTATLFSKYPESELRRYKRKGYDIELELNGIRYTIDDKLFCYKKSQ